MMILLIGIAIAGFAAGWLLGARRRGGPPRRRAAARGEDAQDEFALAMSASAETMLQAIRKENAARLGKGRGE